MSSRSRIRFPRAVRLMPLAGAFRHRELCNEASDMSRVEIVRRLSTSIINLWRWRQGVQPNMHYLLALQGLADSMGRAHLPPRVRVRN